MTHRPPGSGKTKTIVAIVGAILSDSFKATSHGIRSDSTTKKLLVCAPSNAAVDELVMRFKLGVKTLSGQERKLNIVRIGRSDAMNANVKDVTLEELVNKKLGIENGNGNGNDQDTKRKLFDEHKQISQKVREAQDQLNSGTVKGPDASKLQDDLNALRRLKQQLGTKIDNVKDDERVASRNADLNRRRAQEQVLGNAHVICATLSGSGHEMFQGLSIEFETVIVDEAAQCVEMSALIPLKYGCSKCILVGDPKQLPPTVFSKQAARFQYEQSLFVRMQNNHPDDVHLLDTQYRMHPEISLFPSRTFYDGKLLDGADMAGLRQRPWHASSLLAPYQFYDVQGQHRAEPKGHSLINEAEVNVAMQLYKRITSDYGDKFDFRGKIGIITPYKSQLRYLKEKFSRQYGPDILTDVEFNTTDAFQGRESEIIIFSCVRASSTGGVGFLQDIRRMNVGLTRAKSSLWVLGNSSTLVKGEFWKKLIVDAKARDRMLEGNVMNMLGKHSSAYPAPNGGAVADKAGIKKEIAQQEMDRVSTQIKKEPKPYSSMDWMPSAKSDGDFKSELGFDFNNVKSETGIKSEQHIKEENGTYRKPDPNFLEDTDMPDVSSRSNSTPASGRSTPALAPLSDGLHAARGSATPVPDASDNTKASTTTTAAGPAAPGAPSAEASARPPGDIIGGMTNPKIRKRRRPDANPLMSKPKKPRPG
jgi:senataxin